MGGCVSQHQNQRQRRRRRRRRSSTNRNSVTNAPFVRRNKPLNRSSLCPKWKSQRPITIEQLHRKREEFWETAPAFEGRKEIWDALNGVCTAIEQQDFELAESILNCANISLPHGTLFDCYDELGGRYQIPVYILSDPINLLGDDQTQSVKNENEDSIFQIPVKFRLSNGKEHRFVCRSDETIGQVKQRLAALENGAIDSQIQRFFFSGQLLVDQITIGQARLKRNFVVQVALNDRPSTANENI